MGSESAVAPLVQGRVRRQETRVVSHRGSGRGPFAIRRDRLIKRQLEPYKWNAERQGEINVLAKAYDLLRAYDDQRHAPPPT